MALPSALTRKFRRHLFPLLFSSFSSSSLILTHFDQPIKIPTDPNLPSLLTSISTAKSHSTQEALSLLRSFTIKPTKELVCSALWELRADWESAVVVFKWGRECECPEAWDLMIWVLGNERRFELAWSLVRRMQRKGVDTRRALVIMMERYAAANEVSKAIKTFHALEKFNIKSDSSTFYALLRALCKNKNVEEAEGLLLSNRKFFPLEAEGFNIILHGWCNILVDVVEAKRLWREMSNCCVTPDGTSYSYIIYCFAKTGNLCDSLRLYDQMKKRGFVPDLIIYNSLIYALTRENCLTEAHNVYNKIFEAGLKPDIETYNSMICSLCEARKLDEAREKMDEMIKNCIQPTIETYHAFAKSEDIEGTLKLLKRMNDAGYGPDSCTFLIILDKFFRLDESESALRIWSEMGNYSVVPDSSHYMALVQGLVTCGWIPKAMEFYNKMKSKGFPSDPKYEKIFQAFVSNTKNHWGRGKEYVIPPHKKRNPLGDVNDWLKACKVSTLP